MEKGNGVKWEVNRKREKKENPMRSKMNENDAAT